MFQTVFGHSLGSELGQHILQVVGVRIAVACHIAVHLSLVVDLVPHHCVGLPRGARSTHSKDESSLPGHLQELQDLPRRGKDTPLIVTMHLAHEVGAMQAQVLSHRWGLWKHFPPAVT